jgi:hypothetical protein
MEEAAMTEKTPPTELGRYVLRLLRAYRNKTATVLTYQAIHAKQGIESTGAELQIAQESIKPLVRQTFRQAEEELLAGREPLLVLKDFLDKP